MEIDKVIKYPVSTEKGIKLMESENKLIFVVDGAATKPEIKKAIEKMFSIKVEKVNTYIMQGKKRAYIKINAETPAINVATQMGLI
jgi:ribosomal protein L23